MTASPAHAPPALPVVDGCLLVGGRRLEDLAHRVGRTPFYAYDRAQISRRVAGLRAVLPRDVAVHYAVKANPMPALVQHVSALVDGLDLASAGELARALDTGRPPETLSFAGPGKTDRELGIALASGVVVNLESETETERLARLGMEHGIRPRVAVRVNPDFELRSSGMKMGGGPRPFGVDAERVPALLGRIGELDLDFRGFHIFCGSQSLNIEGLMEAHTASVRLALQLSESAPAPARTLNIGGGLGIPYFPGDRRLDPAPLGANLAALSEEVSERLGDARIVLELGRYLVGEAGVYVCRVVERKQSRGRTFLVTDGGMHHHLAASGNLGQVIRRNYPVVVPDRVGGHTEEVSVVGPLCTPLDVLADRVQLPPADAGDLIAVLQSGAYGRSASPLEFLGHSPPPEVLV